MTQPDLLEKCNDNSAIRLADMRCDHCGKPIAAPAAIRLERGVARGRCWPECE